jgi:hypothetical protein
MTTARVWVGRSLSGFALLFLAVDGVMKVARATPSVQATVGLGYAESSLLVIGVLILAGSGLYAVPATSVLGALWLTAFLGGAASAQLRVGAPWLSHILFPAYLCVVLWAGLLLRRPELWALIRPGRPRPESQPGLRSATATEEPS